MRYADKVYHSYSTSGRRKGEDAECSVTVTGKVKRKINLICDRTIQMPDGSREEAVLELVGT